MINKYEIIPSDLAILHFVKMPCSILNEIVRNRVFPNFHPIVGSGLQSGACFQGHLQQKVVVQPYASAFGPKIYMLSL